MQEPQFADFNSLYQKMKYSNICDYNDCGQYADSIGQVIMDTQKVKQLDFMMQMVDQYQGQPNVNVTQVL